MATTTKTYEIELTASNNSGAGDTMYRSGVKFTVRQPEILELTQDEVEVFENDWRFTVTDSKDTGETLESRKTRESTIVPPDSVTGAEAIVDSETETVADTATPQEEADSVEDAPTGTVEDLLKNHSREELDLQAAELGIKNPEDFANKTEVAEAILNTI